MVRIDHHITRHIDRLKERPHDERRALASSVALGVVCVLFIGWAIYFLHHLRTTFESTEPTASQNATAEASSTQTFLEE